MTLLGATYAHTKRMVTLRCVKNMFTIQMTFIINCLHVSKVAVKCPVTYISVPVLDKRFVQKPKTSRAKSKMWSLKNRKGKQKLRKGTGVTKKKPEVKVVYQLWPVINPAELFKKLIHETDHRLICGEGWCWKTFWQQASKEQWCQGHPVLELSEELRSKAVAATFHGDEGQCKRSRNCLILSWSSIAVTGRSEVTKFPFCVS